MRLAITPIPSIPQMSDELEIVILVNQDGVPEVFAAEDLPKPDRHLLLALAQTVAMAVEEQDPESVVFLDSCSIRLDRSGDWKDVAAGLVLVKSRQGRFGGLVVGDSICGKRLTRKAVRWFTGTIRLDVP